MKKIAVILMLAWTLTSCTGFLDIRTEATMPTTGTDYTKAELIFQSVSAAYASLRLSEGEAFSYVSVLEVPSDDADKGSTATDGPLVAELDAFSFGPTNSLINDVWIKFFNIVSAANHAISEMASFREALPDDADKAYTDQCAAEARLIRAYAYFNLLRLFGSVPIVDRPMSAAELASLPSESEQRLYDFIYEDLDAGIRLLPESHKKAWKGRFTCYTACALKAKLALYRQDWEEAARQADAIIGSQRFSLLSHFRDVFSMEYENSVESLMEIQASSLGQSTGDAPVCYYAFIQGPRDNRPSNLQGWGFKVPSQSLVNFLQGRGDQIRMAATLLARGSVTPEGDEILASCPNPYYNGKVYTPSAYNLWSYNGYGFDYNMRIIRYAEILLIYAEARAQGALAGKADPQACFDLVRDRAGLPSVPATLENIYEERRAELALEENRFFDLVRTGKAAAVLGAKGYRKGRNEHFPVPAAQLQLNPALSPSPGYVY